MAQLVIALSIPFFFLGILLELWVARRRGVRAYRFGDAIASLSCGIGQQVTALVVAPVHAAAYLAAFHATPLPTWPETWGAWVVALLLYDHQYYWWHRTTHRSNLFWTTHVVHHQSEDYNLSTALRQAWFSVVSGVPFYLPLALLGVSPTMYVSVALVDLLYQFWIHTELIDRLGPLEWVLNTPSHHRVHHAVNPRYIDKNYAGILIVWDRLYGTFEPETERPTYGVVEPLRSYDPIGANLFPITSLANKAAAAPTWRDAAWTVLGPPEWRPASLGGPVTIPEPAPHRITWDPHAPAPIRRYVLLWFIVIGLCAGGTLLSFPTWQTHTGVLAVVGVLVSTWVWAALTERHPWGWGVELARLLVTPLVGLAVVADQPAALPVVVALTALALVSSFWWVGPGRLALRDAR